MGARCSHGLPSSRPWPPTDSVPLVPDALLTAHPATPSAHVRSVTAHVQFDRATGLSLRFILTGELDLLSIPSAGAVRRSDRLWEHTCFEAFVSGEGGVGYLEFNLAPSRQWAGYGFAGYRQRDESWTAPTPRIEVVRTVATLEMHAQIPLDAFRPLCPSRMLRLGLTAVVEARDGSLSYWALAHPPGRPDFHHADGFVLGLDVVAAAASQPVADLP
jgi:hypothetical protein